MERERTNTMTTNTKEAALEDLIIAFLETENGYEQGTNEDYNRDFAIDETRLFRFLMNIHESEMTNIGLEAGGSGEIYEHNKQKFLDFLRNEITKRGVIDILRNGIKFYPSSISFYNPTPSERNEQAKVDFEKNIWSVT